MTLVSEGRAWASLLTSRAVMDSQRGTRVRIDLAYDGTHFAGWAVQTDQRTVQGELERSLAVLSRRDDLPRVVVAGRTDAGVHARAQVVHVDLPESVATDRLLLRRLNGLLPPDVRVRRTGLAPEGFDARFSALSRTYRYRIIDSPADVDPLRRHDVLTLPRRLDDGLMQQAAQLLLGDHDFAAYCRRREGATTRRALLGLDWERTGDGLLIATVRADAFCHSMVRSLVGALVHVGEGLHDVEWPGSLLALRSRALRVKVAQAHGLTLEQVEYPADEQLLARQTVTRALRVE